MVGHHHPHHARGQTLPQKLAVPPLSDRRGALEEGRPRVDVLGGEYQVVGTGLRGERQAALLGGGDQLDSIARGEMEDMDRSSGLLDQVGQHLHRAILRRRRARRQVIEVRAARWAVPDEPGKLGVDQQRETEGGEPG